MAPLAQLTERVKRQFYGPCPAGYYSRGGRCLRRPSTPWNNWGRWVALVLIVLFFLFLFFVLSCINARRRRKRGLAPFRGTGWTAVPFGGNKYNGNNTNQNSYAMNNMNNNPNPNSNYATTGIQGASPVPPYSPPHNAPQNNYNQNDGYYAGQESGIQQPQSAYQPGTGGSNVYAPPPGPPPGKGTYGADGVIR